MSDTNTLTSRERFLMAARGQVVDRPPLWIMRQAGRYLPEYRELRKQHSFLEMVKTPELATEVTLQPLRRFPLDAAIIFSDILIVPEALGQPYSYADGQGIQMEWRVQSQDDVERLELSAVSENLAYLPAALKRVRHEIGDAQTLLGFAGSPWSLACYMVEGGSPEKAQALKHLFYTQRDTFEKLLNKLTEAVIETLSLQIEAGVDAVQIFDSWGAACPGSLYLEMSLQWISRIISRLPESTPVIIFAKGMAHHWHLFHRAGASVLSVDWTVDLPALRAHAPREFSLQGNLDPTLLETEPAIVERAARQLLVPMRGQRGHILNLGHGITPQARIECVEALIRAAHAVS